MRRWNARLALLRRRRSSLTAVVPEGAEARCRYLAVIPDGNGRWAQGRGLPVGAGHRAGAKALHAVIERALDHGVLELTAFSFSTENWSRPPEEVAALMDLFVEMIEREMPQLHEQGVRVRFLGRRRGVAPELVARMERSEALTAGNHRMTFYIAFNYGGRAELADAARAYAVAHAGVSGSGEDETIDLRPYLYAPEMHDPELLIRTSGELRISNFLLWQLAYTELAFSSKLWPDFGPQDLDEVLADFAQRRRRYGGR